MTLDTPPITPQQYEVLHGGGAEAAEIAQQRLSRRRFLRRSMLAVWGLFLARAQWRRIYPMVLVAFIVCVSQFPGVGEERYMTPIVPLLMIFAAHGLTRLSLWWWRLGIRVDLRVK